MGVGGSTGLVVTANGSALATNAMGYAGFAVNVAVLASATNGVNTTNLRFYRLYAAVKTCGLTRTDSHGRVQWQFLTPDGPILSVSLQTTFTTNYQMYSFVLGDGSIDPDAGGSWGEFVAQFDQINRVQCAVSVDTWLDYYNLDAENALCVDDIKFVRLVPDESVVPANTSKTNTETPHRADEAR